MNNAAAAEQAQLQALGKRLQLRLHRDRGRVRARLEHS
jgi:hypothetical protein